MNRVERAHIEANLSADIAAALEAYAETKRTVQETVAAVRQECKHLEVVEVKYQSMDYGKPLAPFRVCLGCRKEEDGKSLHGSYEILTAEPAFQIDRNEGYALRLPQGTEPTE